MKTPEGFKINVDNKVSILIRYYVQKHLSVIEQSLWVNIDFPLKSDFIRENCNETTSNTHLVVIPNVIRNAIGM